MWQNVNNKKTFNLNVSADWFADSTGFWFTIQNKNAKSFMKFDFATMQPGKWFDHEKLAELLAKELKEEIKSNDLPISTLGYIGKNELKFTAKNRNLKLDVRSNLLSQNGEKPDEENPMESKSPNGNWIAFTKDYNLFIKSVETGEERPLSWSGVKTMNIPVITAGTILLDCSTDFYSHCTRW